MRKSIVAVILVLFASAGLDAETTREGQRNESQVVTPDPASREDLRKATAEMKKVVREAEKKSAAQAAKARDDAERQHRETLRREAEADEKLRAEVVATAEESAAKTRKMVFWGVGGVGAVSLLIALGAFFVRSGTKAPEVRVVQNHEEHVDGILEDPTKEQLEAYSTKNKGINPVPFFAVLTRENLKPLCKVQLGEGSVEPRIVEADGRSCSIGWKNYPRKLARFLQGEIVHEVAS